MFFSASRDARTTIVFSQPLKPEAKNLNYFSASRDARRTFDCFTSFAKTYTSVFISVYQCSSVAKTLSVLSVLCGLY